MCYKFRKDIIRFIKKPIVWIIITSIVLLFVMFFYFTPINTIKKQTFKFTFNKFKQKDIAEFIDYTELNLKIVRNHMKYRRTNLIDSVFKGINNEEYMTTLQNYQKEISSISLYISKETPPKELEKYKNMTLNYLDTSFLIISYTLQALNSPDIDEKNKYIDKCNDLISKYNYQSKEMTEELISVFNKIGMNYKIHNGKVTYWWRD